MTYHLGQWSSTFFTGMESFEHLDCLRIACRVCSTPNGQKHHFPILSYQRKKNTNWYRCMSVTLIAAYIKYKLMVIKI